MQKNQILNFYKSWKMVIYPFWDTKFQLRNWFRHEGTEVSSFEDEIGNFLQRYLDQKDHSEYHFFYQSELGKVVKQLYEKVHEYFLDIDSSYTSGIEEKFFTDPKWLTIVSLAKKMDEGLNQLIKEVENEY